MRRAILTIACNYPGVPVRQLKTGLDVAGIAGFFEHRVRYDLREVLQDPSPPTVFAALDRVLAQLRPGDLLVVYLTGHGVQDDNPLSEPVMVLPADPTAAQTANLQAGGAHLQVTPGVARKPPLAWLSVEDLRRRTEHRGLDCAVLVDCCRLAPGAGFEVPPDVADLQRSLSKDGAVLRRDVSLEPVAQPAAKGPSGSFAALFACEKLQAATEVDTSGMGLFSTAIKTVLNRARNKGRAVRVDDRLQRDVQKAMERLARRAGLRLVPRTWKSGHGTPLLVPARKRAGAGTWTAIAVSVLLAGVRIAYGPMWGGGRNNDARLAPATLPATLSVDQPKPLPTLTQPAARSIRQLRAAVEAVKPVAMELVAVDATAVVGLRGSLLNDAELSVLKSRLAAIGEPVNLDEVGVSPQAVGSALRQSLADAGLKDVSVTVRGTRGGETLIVEYAESPAVTEQQVHAFAARFVLQPELWIKYVSYPQLPKPH